MKKKSFPTLLMYVTLCCALIFALGLMAGCKGDTGSAGATGPTGPQGPAGPGGVAAAANEQCLICHGVGGIAAIADMHTVSPLSATTAPITLTGGGLVDINQQNAAQLAGLTMVGTVQTVNNPGTTPVVGFTVEDSSGHGIVGLTTTNMRFAIAELVSAATGTYWQSYMVTATSRPTTENAAANLTDNGNGTYTYTFTTNLSNVPNVTFDTNATHRLAIQVSGNVAGGSLNDRAINIIQDFVPANLPAFTGTTSHDIVTTAACDKCHYKLGTTTPHGGRVDTKYCVVCHTYQRAIGRAASSPDASGALTGSTYLIAGQVDLATEPTSSAGGFATGEMVTLVHKIHKSEGLSLTGYNYAGVLFNEITYPQDIRNCTMCHNGTDGDNWKNKPSRKACGSCHDNVSFATTVPTGFVAHSGGVYNDDTTCSFCHGATAGLAPIVANHVPVVPPDPTDPRLGGTNTHTNAEYIAAAGVVPPGAHQISYLVSSVTTSNSHPSITFKFHDNTSASDMVFTAPTSTTDELMPNFAGSPSAYFAWAVPQDGITAPSDFNKTASGYIKKIWNGSVTNATMTGPDASGFYTVTLTGTTIPANAVMLTGGIGYTYGSGSPPLVQTNLPLYPYNATTGVGGLSVPAPNVWMVASGYTGRRVVVDTAKCDACHVALGVAPTFHVGQRNDAPTCSFCHNPNRTSEGWALNASTFVHAIHGASKRTVPFTWDATSVAGDEADDGFFGITYPNLLNKCDACHVDSNTGIRNGKDCYTGAAYDFSCVQSVTVGGQNINTTVYTDAVMKGMLFSTTATGTFSSTAEDVFTFSPYVALDTNYGSSGSGDNLVTSPISAACFACHDSSVVMDHMRANGGAVYEKRSTAIQP